MICVTSHALVAGAAAGRRPPCAPCRRCRRLPLPPLLVDAAAMAAAELNKLLETVVAAAKKAEGGDAAEQVRLAQQHNPNCTWLGSAVLLPAADSSELKKLSSW